jgi:hypothetical protein
MKMFWMIVGTAVLCAAGLSAQDDDFFETRNERFDIASSKPLEVILKVDAGEVTIEPGEANAAAVFMEYDKAEYFSDIDWNAKSNRLEIRLDKRHWFRWHKSDDGQDDIGSEIKLTLPTGADLLLDCKVKAGESVLHLGGLRIKELSMETWAGETELNFETPNPIVMDFLDVEAKVGECRLNELGNARFERAVIDGGIGELQVDFTGSLVSGCKARLNLNIGEASVILPVDFGNRVEIGGALSFMSKKNVDHALHHRGRAYFSDGYEDNKDKFSLYIKPGLGELNVDTRE